MNNPTVAGANSAPKKVAVFLVHGFTGGADTWGGFGELLNAGKDLADSG